MSTALNCRESFWKYELVGCNRCTVDLPDAMDTTGLMVPGPQRLTAIFRGTSCISVFGGIQRDLQTMSAAMHAGKPSKDTGSGSQEQTYVKTVIELHDKYLQVGWRLPPVFLVWSFGNRVMQIPQSARHYCQSWYGAGFRTWSK